MERYKNQFLYLQGILDFPVLVLVIRPSPVFLCLPSNAFLDIGSVGRIEKKRKPKKKITRSLGIVGPGTAGRRTFTYLD